jgi:IPT/TIG domain
VVVVNSTTITATAPAGSAGAVTVTVTANGQSGSLASAYTYIAPPTVSSVAPSGGSPTGGTAVTITGTNFAAGATVKFGSTAATNVVVVSSTSITATTPAGSAGAVTVTVTNSNGLSGSLTSGFTYTAPPTVSSVSPNSGSTLGGTAVTITGTNLFTGATVTFAGAAATSVVVVNSTTITATTPAGSAGAVTVTVTVNGQSGSLASAFTYVVASGITAPGNFAGALMGTSAPIYVAGQESYNATAGTSFTSAPFNSTGADLLVMFLGCHNNTVFTITDSNGNTWIPLAGPAYKVGTDFFPMEGEFFYAPNATTGAGHTITVGLSQTEPLVMSIAALSGDNIYSPIDTYSSITGDNGTIAKYISSSPLTTSQPNDLLLGIVKGFGNNTYTAGTGYSAQSASTGLNFSAETQMASSAGTYTSSFTASVGDFWQTVIAAIAPKPNETALLWTASTGGIIANYYIERCAGLGCSSFSQIASVSGSTLTYTDTTISSGTVYNYRVRAQDSSGNFSTYSNVLALTPIIPYVVSSFAVTPARKLSWNPSAESGGSVSQYSIERCTGLGCSNFSQIATTSSTSYTDTSAAAGTTYNYRVRAQDANNFYGPYSVTAAASIPAYFDNAADGGNNGGSTTSLTYSYAVGTNSNRLLLVNLIGDSSADDISSVTYAGTSMTLIKKVQPSGSNWHYLYYLLGPASGTHNVVITAASSHFLISEAISWYNVAQSGQPAAFTTNTAAADVVSMTTSLPASSNNAIVAESMWAPLGILPSNGSSELIADSAFQSLGMFTSVASPVTQAFPVSITNTSGGQDAASSIMASFTLASNGTPGITFDNSADGGNNNGTTTSLTYSYTVGTGPNRLLVVNLIGDTSADDITSVTYAGALMTFAGKVQAPSSNNWQYLYYLLNPPSGTNNIVATAASTHYLISQAASWYNVRQTAQLDAFTTNTLAATNTSATTSLTTTAAGSLVVQGVWSFGHLAAGTGAIPIVIDTAIGGAGIFASSGSPVSPAGNVSMTTISDGTISTGIIMVSFAPAP